MKIEFFKSTVCPRCTYVKGILTELQKKHDQIEVEAIDIATQFNRWQDLNTKVFPALKIGSEVKGWYLPNKKEIEDFVLSKLS